MALHFTLSYKMISNNLNLIYHLWERIVSSWHNILFFFLLIPQKNPMTQPDVCYVWGGRKLQVATKWLRKVFIKIRQIKAANYVNFSDPVVLLSNKNNTGAMHVPIS